MLGHSLNRIDIPYFIEILNRSEDAIWNVSYYNDQEKTKHTQTLIELGITSDQIQLFKL